MPSRTGMRAALVGCGITGSWVLPVLARRVNKLDLYDDDIVDDDNLQGLWHTDQGPKVTAALEKRFDAPEVNRYRVHKSRITRKSDFRGTFDLVVLCPDNAPTRLLIGEICAEKVKSGRTTILDIRATPTELVVWSIQNRSDWKTWMKSLEGYPAAMPCGHHDNVPMLAGATATHFMSWWMTHGMTTPRVPFGIPYVFS